MVCLKKYSNLRSTTGKIRNITVYSLINALKSMINGDAAFLGNFIKFQKGVSNICLASFLKIVKFYNLLSITYLKHD